jgi:hypothetical protein
MSPKEYVGALHSVAPMGLPAFDFFYRFNKSTVLGPMPPDIPQAENGKNKLSWGKKFQDQFVKQFDFKVVAEEEDKQIKAYYLTKHWKDTITNVMNPQIMHCHANFEINFDPKIFELYTRQALAEIGWRVEKVVPCVYDVKGTYTGKNVFLVGYPEKVFDTTWRFNPDVVIRSSEKSFLYGIDPGFDIWYRPQLDKVLDANNFYKMSNDEISEVIASFNR